LSDENALLKNDAQSLQEYQGELEHLKQELEEALRKKELELEQTKKETQSRSQ